VADAVHAELAGAFQTMFKSLHDDLDAISHRAEPSKIAPLPTGTSAPDRPSVFKAGASGEAGDEETRTSLRKQMAGLSQSDQDALAPLLIGLARRAPVQMRR